MEKIENEKLNSWVIKSRNLKREDIAEGTGLSLNRLRTALKLGYATPDTEKILTEYFSKIEVPA